MFTSIKRSVSVPLGLSVINVALVTSSARIQEGETLAQSVLLATLAGLIFALLSLRARLRREPEQARAIGEAVGDAVEVSVKRAHIVQIIAQGSVYVGWCLSWGVAASHLPLLLAQIVFAYLIDMGLSWCRYPKYRLGLGPIPIVMSTNLFLFFVDSWFGWQWALIAFALVSRELFTWQRGGRTVHIFNPSAIALSLFALTLISTETMHFTWGEAIARTHGYGPLSYEIMFGAGLLVASLFTVGFTIVSAATMTLLLGEWYLSSFGVFRYVDTGIPIAVFLGMNLLVTDPVSSPWRRDAKVLYGALYGVSVFALYGLLRDLERVPTQEDIGLSAAFCDKLLAVPLLNLSARALDALMERMMGTEDRGLAMRALSWERSLKQRLGVWSGRVAFASLWIALFIGWVRPAVREHPGRDVRFWAEACEREEPHRYACSNRDRLYQRSCESGVTSSCRELGLSLMDQDLGRAESLFTVACEAKDHASCYLLSDLLWRTHQRAHQRDARAGSSGASASSDDSAGRRDSLQGVLVALERACDQGSPEGLPEACERFTSIVLSPEVSEAERASWSAERWREVWTLLRGSCERNDPRACRRLSSYYLMPYPVARGRCDRGDQLACLTIKTASELMEQEAPQAMRGDHPLHSRARAQLEVACRGDVTSGCVDLARMLWFGHGGARDPDRARSLLRGACDAQFAGSCEILQQLNASP